MTVTRMGLWIGQVVQVSDLNERFENLDENVGSWRLDDKGYPVEYECLYTSSARITLEEVATPACLFADMLIDDDDAMILGVNIALRSEGTELVPGSSWFNGDLCFNITELALANPELIASRMGEVVKMLKERNLPNDRVGCILVAVPKR